MPLIDRLVRHCKLRYVVLVIGAAAAFIAMRPSPKLIALTTQLQVLDGSRPYLSDFRQHPVLVVFWASDCRACRTELPQLVKLHEQYAAQGLVIIAVAMNYDPPSQVVAVQHAEQLPFRVALDPLGQVAEAFGNVALVPHTFLLAPDGHVVTQVLGLPNQARLTRDIEAMLERS